MTLSILCVTKMEPHAISFLVAMSELASVLDAEFVLAIDGDYRKFYPPTARVVSVKSKGFVESVLDEAVDACCGDYVLRLDDDERCSPAMVSWLYDDAFLDVDHWKFPRMHLWPNDRSVMLTSHLFPDVQTRLSVKKKSGGRHTVHAGSPFGGGEEAPVAIEHHKFLVRSHDERLAIAQVYDRHSPGYGTGDMKPFSLPEDTYETVKVVAKGDGTVPWVPAFTYEVSMNG